MEITLLHPPEDYLAEIYSEFKNRYSGFGKDIYVKIKEQLPKIFYKLNFYRRHTFQTEDSYAEYKDNVIQFAIQLDPLCEVIVLWNKQKHIEIGTWSNNEYEEAIDYIKSEFVK